MYTRTRLLVGLAVMLLTSLLLLACGSTLSPTSPLTSAGATASATPPDWFTIPMTDVRTGQSFTINDFAGKIVLIESIAQWCPNCLFQQGETRKMRQQLGNPDDLVVISLDVDVHEDAASLKKYTEEFGFDWRFGVALAVWAAHIAMLRAARSKYLCPIPDSWRRIAHIVGVPMVWGWVWHATVAPFAALGGTSAAVNSPVHSLQLAYQCCWRPVPSWRRAV